MTQYYRFESIQFESKNVPLGKINYEEFSRAKIMIEDRITLESKESSIEWFPEHSEYEEQIYWIYMYQHIYTLINNTIKKLLIEMNSAPYVFELIYTPEGDGFILSFVNHYQNFRFYFNKYLLKLFEMFKYNFYSNDYYTIDTTASEFTISECRFVKYPLRTYVILINGKKLITFTENQEIYKKFIFYKTKPQEVIYLREDYNVEIFVNIDNATYYLKNVEYEIAYTHI